MIQVRLLLPEGWQGQGGGAFAPGTCRVRPKSPRRTSQKLSWKGTYEGRSPKRLPVDVVARV